MPNRLHGHALAVFARKDTGNYAAVAPAMNLFPRGSFSLIRSSEHDDWLAPKNDDRNLSKVTAGVGCSSFEERPRTLLPFVTSP